MFWPVWQANYNSLPKSAVEKYWKRKEPVDEILQLMRRFVEELRGTDVLHKAFINHHSYSQNTGRNFFATFKISTFQPKIAFVENLDLIQWLILQKTRVGRDFGF